MGPTAPASPQVGWQWFNTTNDILSVWDGTTWQPVKAVVSGQGYATPELGGVYERARELCEAIGDTSSLFHVTWGNWGWRLLRDDLDTCMELGAEMLRPLLVLHRNRHIALDEPVRGVRIHLQVALRNHRL